MGTRACEIEVFSREIVGFHKSVVTYVLRMMTFISLPTGSQRSPSPGLRWFTRSRAKEDAKAQEEEEEKERLPADSAATTRAVL